MRFSFTLLTAFLSACSITTAQLTADQIVANLDKITIIERGINAHIQILTPALIVKDGPMALNGLREVIGLVSGDITAISDGGVQTKYSAEDQKKICDALGRFTHANKFLLYYLYDKKSVLNNSPLGAPFGSLVLILASGYDGLTKQIITTVPTCAADSQNAIKEVNESFSNVISILT